MGRLLNWDGQEVVDVGFRGRRGSYPHARGPATFDKRMAAPGILQGTAVPPATAGPESELSGESSSFPSATEDQRGQEIRHLRLIALCQPEQRCPSGLCVRCIAGQLHEDLHGPPSPVL